MILVFGKTGQVASYLANKRDVLCLSREQADFTQPQTLMDVINHYKPKAVINAVAYTDVDGAETNHDLALCVNAKSVKAIASACLVAGIPLVHISSDYVFDGAGDCPKKPTDAKAPLNYYGYTCLLYTSPSPRDA